MHYFDERFGEYWADADMAVQNPQSRAGKLEMVTRGSGRSGMPAGQRRLPEGGLFTNRTAF